MSSTSNSRLRSARYLLSRAAHNLAFSFSANPLLTHSAESLPHRASLAAGWPDVLKDPFSRIAFDSAEPPSFGRAVTIVDLLGGSTPFLHFFRKSALSLHFPCSGFWKFPQFGYFACTSPGILRPLDSPRLPDPCLSRATPSHPAGSPDPGAGPMGDRAFPSMAERLAAALTSGVGGAAAPPPPSPRRRTPA